MRYFIFLLLAFSLVSCGVEQELEDAANDETGQSSTEAFVEQCTDPVFPVVEQLNEMQRPASGEIVMPVQIKSELVTIYIQCVSIIDSLIAKTYQDYEKKLKGKTCMLNAQESRAALTGIKEQLLVLETAEVTTKEGREQAFAAGGMLHLPISLLHGRVALNYETYCKLPSVFK